MSGRKRAPWLIRALVRLYPLDFRREFGRDVEKESADTLAEGSDGGRRLGAWVRVVRDVSLSVCREHWDTWVGDVREGGMASVLQDVRRVARGFVRTPGFTAVVVLTLGLGVGATTSIFSVVHGVLLAPLPYPEADRIVSVSEAVADAEQQSISVSYVNGQDWKTGQTTLDAMALVRGGAVTLNGPDGAQQVSALFADPEYFEVFGTEAARGRLFEEADNRVPGGHPVAVLTHDAWDRLFGSDPGVIGAAIDLGGTPYTVLGVLSATYRDPFGGANGAGNDFIIPAMMAGIIDPRGEDIVTVRRWRTFGAVGKTRPGVAIETADADLKRVAAQLESVDAVNRGMTAVVLPFNQVATTTFRGPALALLGGALVLLLIACFNVANLLLVRGAAREHELALQYALGAGRGRLLRLLATESALLALIGGALGITLASLTLPTLLSLIPNQLPPTADVHMSLPVLAAAMALSLGAGLVFGLIPAIRLGGRDLRPALSGARSGGSRKGERVRSGLVVFEMATATVLLAASAVLVRGFEEIRSADSGFVTENVLSLRVNLPPATYIDQAGMARAAAELSERLSSVPGAEWAHAWGPGRPGQSFNFQTSIPEGMVVDQIMDSPLARRHQIGAGGLEDMGISLLRGRTFTDSDRLGTPGVAIISESMAQELWPGEDAVGKQYHNFQPPGQPIPTDRMWTVVGVVADARHGGRVSQPGAITTPNDSYFPIAQRPERSFTLLVKFNSAPDVAPVREAIRSYDSNIPITQVATMAENFAVEEGTSRFAAQLMAAFGLGALLLAALGVYGVIAFTVSQRTREIGLRAALGADSRAMLHSVMRRGLVLALAGVTIGVLVATAAIRGLQAVVPNVPGMDAPALAIASTALVLMAVVACLVPAARATRVSPVVALKGD